MEKDYQHTSELLHQIEQAARQAGAIMMEAHDIASGLQAKAGRQNFATEYDAKVQDFLFDRFRKLIPDAHFFGEEEGQDIFYPEYEQGYTFVIDPIDGTSNFMKGLFPFVTSIALLKDGKPFIGVVYAPLSDQMFSAEIGQGAYENHRLLHTSDDTLEQSLVMFGTAPYYEGLPKQAFELALKYMSRGIDVRRSGACAYDLCLVASGRIGLYFEPVVQLYDYAAGATILIEAGGTFSDLNGQPVSFHDKSSMMAVGRGVAQQNYLPEDF